MSAPVSSSILYAQLRSAGELGVFNRHNGKLGVALIAIVEEAIQLRKTIEQPIPDQQQEINLLQQAHEQFLVDPNFGTKGWILLRVPAFSVIGSGIPQENYDRIISEIIQKHELRRPVYSRREVNLPHPGCKCKGECGGGEPLVLPSLPPPLDSDEGITLYLTSSTYGLHTLAQQLANVKELIDSGGVSRATIVLIEEAIRLREAIIQQTDAIIHEIAQLKKAHHSFFMGENDMSLIQGPECMTLESALPKENYERLLREVIHKFQLRNENALEGDEGDE